MVVELFLICLLAIVQAERQRPVAAVVEVQQLDKPFLAEIALFGRLVPKSPSNALTVKLFDAQSEGCSTWNASPTPPDTWFAVVQRGTCSFLNKSLHASSAGASGVFIVSQDNTLAAMYASPEDLERAGGTEKIIPTLMVTKQFYDQISKLQDPVISMYIYLQQMWDPTMLLVAILATLVVIGGAYYSSDLERSQFHGLNRTFRERQEMQEVTSEMAWGFVCVASVGLILLFYFLNHLIYVILFIFVIGSANGLSNVGTHVIEYFFPDCHFKYINLYYEFRVSEIVASIPSLALCIVWAIFRARPWAWILQDIMCIGLLMILQRVLQFPNLKISAILLSTAFFYDIFWVFLSPFIFKKSVMVEVARGGDTGEVLPMLIAVPRIEDPFHSPMMLGLGDMALPGLLISFLLRSDYKLRFNTWTQGYFMWSVIGYFIGLVFTYISLVLMQHGQPALLFLVPCTLGLTVILAWRRNQLNDLWSGEIGMKSADETEETGAQEEEDKHLLDEDVTDVPLT